MYVARSSLFQQDIRNFGQVVCVGERWAASIFFVRVLDDGDLFFYFHHGRSGVTYPGTAISKGVITFFCAVKLKTNSHSLVIKPYDI